MRANVGSRQLRWGTGGNGEEETDRERADYEAIAATWDADFRQVDERTERSKEAGDGLGSGWSGCSSWETQQ